MPRFSTKALLSSSVCAKRINVLPAKCPYLNRCNKYTELTCRIDRQKDIIAAKDREIARLKAENAALKAAQCGGKTNPAKLRPFGSSTPSSKIPIKENSTEEARRRIGGREKGHPGSGREAVDDPDEKIELPKPVCPTTRLQLSNFQIRTRTITHVVPARSVTRRYTIYRAWCPACGCYHESQVPGVMPYFAFSNDLIAQVLVDHFGNGIPLGTLARRSNLKKAALSNMAHRVAGMLEGGLPKLLEEFRTASVKHADETTWSCDGKNGYAWGFFTPKASLYRFRATRGSVVAEEVFGDVPHTGVLGVDRYAVYGGAWKGAIQYCLEHYKRNVQDLLDAEPKRKEYKKYIPHFVELLKKAMKLRSRFKGKEYNDASRRIRDEILEWISAPMKDGKLKGYFDYMSETRHRFFQWVDHPEVEAENNLAERRLRPLITARKVCFGSQSERGLRTRETLMSIIDSLKLRFDDPVKKLSEVLNALARNKNADVGNLLWGGS